MIKLILGAVIGVALYTTVAKADTQTVTPKEFVNTVASVPHKVSTHLQNEWVDIKEYQKKSWAESKAQLARTKDQILGFFTKSSK